MPANIARPRPLPAIDARAAHAESRKLVAKGIHPVQARREERETRAQAELHRVKGSFGAVCADWNKATSADLRPATVQQRNREIEKDLTPRFKDRPISKITRLELTANLKDVEARAPEVARNQPACLSGRAPGDAPGLGRSRRRTTEDCGVPRESRAEEACGAADDRTHTARGREPEEDGTAGQPTRSVLRSVPRGLRQELAKLCCNLPADCKRRPLPEAAGARATAAEQR